MIKLQHDVDTAGTRVSFVMKDGERSFCPQGVSLDEFLSNVRQNIVPGECNIQQNLETLRVVRLMLDWVIEEQGAKEAPKVLECKCQSLYGRTRSWCSHCEQGKKHD